MSFIGQIIKLKLKSFDSSLLDRAVTDIVSTVKRTGATLKGPIPLPGKRKVYTVNRSTHVNKKAREQFEIRRKKVLVVIYPSSDTVERLMGLELPSGVEIDIKLNEA